MNAVLRWPISLAALAMMAASSQLQDSRIWVPQPKTNELRQAWIEQRHRAAPGVDWRQRDAKSRVASARNPISKSASLLANGRDGVWQELGSSNQSGRIVWAKLDPIDDTLWALADGGQLWTKPLDGPQWSVQNDQYRLHRQDELEFVLVNGKRRLVRSGFSIGARLQFSDNGGGLWHEGAGQNSPYEIHMSIASQDINSSELFRIVRRWDPTPNIEYMDVYYSADGGETTQLIDTVPGHLAKLFSPDQTSTYALIDNKLFRVSPTGLSLLTSIPGLTSDQFYFLTLSGGSGHFYAYYQMTDGGTPVYRSLNGQAFEYRGDAPTGHFMHNSFAASIHETDTVYMGGINGHVSHDGGASWDQISEWYEYYERPMDRLHADIPAFSPVIDSNNDELLLIGTDGGLYTSDPNVTAVNNVSLSGLNVSQYYDTYSVVNDPDIMFAGSQDQGFQRNTSVSQSPWFEQVISGDYNSLQSGDGGNSLWSVYVTFAMYSPVATATPMPLEFWNYDFSGALFLAPLAVHASDPTRAWLGGGGINDQHFLHLLSWQPASGITPISYNHDFGSAITAIATDPHDTANLFVTNDDALFVSDDEGQTWSETPFPDGTYFFPTSIAVDPSQANRILVSGSGYSAPGIFQSLDQGQTLEPMTEGLPDTLVSEINFSADGTLLFAATDLGPYAWDNELNRWYSLQQGVAPDQRYISIEWVDAVNAARFATYGRGIWQMSVIDGEGTVLGEQVGRGDRSGNAVAVGANTVVSGAWFSKVNGVRSGAAYIHQRSEFGQWNQTEQLLPPNPSIAMRFGTSVALSPDQSIAIVGSPSQDNKDGGVYVYLKDSIGHWNLVNELSHPTGNSGTEFGIAVAVTEMHLFVGSRRHKQGNRNTGAVFVYDLSPDGVANFEQTLFHDESRHGDRFGSAVAVDNDHMVIGSPLRDDDGKSNSGAAFVFRLDGDHWHQMAELTAPTTRTGDQFGTAVAINSGTVAVGAPLRNVDGLSNNGAAFAFTLGDDGWTGTGELSSGQLNAGDKLGAAVAVAGESIIVGAPFHDTNKSNAGAVLSFRFHNEQWTQRWLRQSPSPQKGERLGAALAATGPRLFVGAEQRDSNAVRAGMVFVMRDDNPEH